MTTVALLARSVSKFVVSDSHQVLVLVRPSQQRENREESADEKVVEDRAGEDAVLEKRF